MTDTLDKLLLIGGLETHPSFKSEPFNGDEAGGENLREGPDAYCSQEAPA